MESLRFRFFLFLSERCDNHADTKKHTSDRNVSEKNKGGDGQALRLFAHAIQIRG